MWEGTWNGDASEEKQRSSRDHRVRGEGQGQWNVPDQGGGKSRKKMGTWRVVEGQQVCTFQIDSTGQAL